MTDEQFRAFLNLMMCCDPWPIQPDEGERDILWALMDEESGKRGFGSWIDAYHQFHLPVASEGDVEGSWEGHNVKGVVYSTETRELTVDFSSGARYRYSDVPDDTAKGLIASAHPGTYLSENIKGRYRYSRLT